VPAISVSATEFIRSPERNQKATVNGRTADAAVCSRRKTLTLGLGEVVHDHLA
jgi:hypothetical protein